MVSPRRAAAGQHGSDGKPEEVVRVRMLGGFRVSVGERTIEEDAWRLSKAGHLFKLLSLAPGYRLHREQVMDLLWPNLDPEAQANNLYHALHDARRTLQPAASDLAACVYLRLRGEHLALCPNGSIWVDVQAFEEAVKTSRRARDPTAFRAAIELYAGDLLPADRYEDWAEGRRAQLRRAYLDLLVELAGLHEEREELGSALEALKEAVAKEPVYEEAHLGLMRLYAASGRSRMALGQYEQLVEFLSSEQPGSEPGVEVRRLYEEIAAGRFPPADPESRSKEQPGGALSRAPRHNLPMTLSSFVGRRREMARIEQLLNACRLLTLTGSGGSGKTRLALAVARERLPEYADGAWLVNLAPLIDPDLVPDALAAAVGVRAQPGRELLDTLIEYLRHRELLLVLDNCEHLVGACADIAEVLLVECHQVRVLATSREALRIDGETTYLVPSLSMPGPECQGPAELLEESEAVNLFVERARSRQPGFKLTEENGPFVAEICKWLEGIPLAIELAVARVRIMGVEQLASRLDDSLGVLTGGSRTATPRQQTLRGALDWSYDLLSGGERKLFGRLSVFSGGWTLAAAEALEAKEEATEEVLYQLTGLVDKSLVAAEEPEGGTAPRYRMLEPVRQHALERLEESGEAGLVRERHAEYYLALAEEAEPELKEQEAWLERLEPEHGNLRAALQWALDLRDAEELEERAELGLRLAAALAQGRFWNAYGVDEGRRWLERALARSGTSPKAVRAKALSQAGYIAIWQGDYQRSAALLEEGMALFKELEDKPGVATSLFHLGNMALHGGDIERVRALCREAEALRWELADQQAIGLLLYFLGFAALGEGDHDQAVALAEEGLALNRELGDLRGMAMCLTVLGITALEQNDPERAAALYEEDMRVLRRLRDKTGTVYGLRGLAGVASLQGDAARAARLWGAAEALGEAIGSTLSPFDRSHPDYEGLLAAARSRLNDEAAWEAARAEGKAMTPEQAIEYALAEEQETPAEQQPPAPPAPLSRREKEISSLVARGLTNHQIAAALVISERTVETHVSRILKKLGLRSRNQVSARIAR